MEKLTNIHGRLLEGCVWDEKQEIVYFTDIECRKIYCLNPETKALQAMEMKDYVGCIVLEALDDLKENEVYICTGASPSYAVVGELMCTRMQILKAAGAVVNGFHRDTKGILELNFPCFSYGRYAQNQAPRGKVIDYRVPIEIEGVRINPGDIIFGDLDEVVVIPREVETEVIQRAYEKATGEKMVAEAIRAGMGAKESFEKHGIM